MYFCVIKRLSKTIFLLKRSEIHFKPVADMILISVKPGCYSSGQNVSQDTSRVYPSQTIYNI